MKFKFVIQELRLLEIEESDLENAMIKASAALHIPNKQIIDSKIFSITFIDYNINSLKDYLPLSINITNIETERELLK